MQTEDPSGDKPTDVSTRDAQHYSDTDRADLTKIHLRTLAVVVTGDELHGRAVQSQLEKFYGGRVDDSRVYSTLDELAEWKLITKRRDLTNGSRRLYTPTTAGCETLADEVGWLVDKTPGLALTDDVDTGTHLADAAAGDSA